METESGNVLRRLFIKEDFMRIRHAEKQDLEALNRIGEECYSPEERISAEEYEKRLNVYPEHFWILEEEGEIAAFINGPVINQPKIEDDMFHNTAWHDEKGTWQAILGVNTSPRCQNRGYASRIMERLIMDARQQGRKGCVITCKEALIPYYEKFGFQNWGVSASALAGQLWYDMGLTFEEEM